MFIYSIFYILFQEGKKLYTYDCYTGMLSSPENGLGFAILDPLDKKIGQIQLVAGPSLQMITFTPNKMKPIF